MSRNNRLFDLIQILRDGNLHRGADLAQRLGVSTRTIWRDMEVLAASGLPVQGERGLGYILRAPITLPPLILTQEELAALLAFLAQTATLPDSAPARGARSLAAKLAAVVPQMPEDQPR
jgi:predicted DNA-binding transcriptional regulator YafY